jgi:hypothetical protein
MVAIAMTQDPSAFMFASARSLALVERHWAARLLFVLQTLDMGYESSLLQFLYNIRPMDASAIACHVLHWHWPCAR